ncbi:MAG: VacB/RNase II family 3'-5' exoribonuclease, partial [Finegoldia magna]|nr:VacB/RNase II family 3'-5' exoribonuclease [Finegoldia magna]
IADVSHYVRKNTALDKEAFRRGTSVYMLDRVIPMLPIELSNGICSLNPNEDRLCLTVKMEISPTGKTLDYKFYESVINSDYRLVYKNVSDFLEDIENPYDDEKLTDNLLLMKELYEILSVRRKNRGSIDFDFPETKIILDENSKVVDVTKDERRIGNKLIEEFMLITNETVASHFGYLDRPFLYRVHEEPDEEKVNTFKRILSNFGYHLKGKNLYSKDYQRILNELDGKPEKPLLSSLLLRSMQKAEYSENPSIHFGLASMFYTHFTSPIRRYPDLFIHRIVKNFINHKPDTNNEKEFMKYIKDIAKQCSATERRAEEAEREAIDMKSAEYMQQHIDEEFEGIISSLTNFGIFVQLDNTIEGLVQFQSMIDDYYVFDDKNYTVYGERTKKSYHIGQKVRVKVINSEKDKRQIDFEFVN